MKKIKAIYGSTYKDLERENKKLKQMIQRDRDEVLKEMKSINNQYLTELFIQQNKINRAIEYIKERLIEVANEELQWVEMGVGDYNKEYKILLEILEGKNE